MDNKSIDDWLREHHKGFLVGYVAGSIVQFSLAYCLTNRIPNVKAPQPGYVAPSKLEIVMEDLDKDGKNETVLEYDGKKYLLLYDAAGPRIAPYKIKSAQIVIAP